MMPMPAWAELFLPCPAPALFSAIFLPSLTLESAALQNLIHRGKGILLPLRHFSGQLRQPRFAFAPAQSALEQPRFQQLDQPFLPMLQMLPLALPAHLKMLF